MFRLLIVDIDAVVSRLENKPRNIAEAICSSIQDVFRFAQQTGCAVCVICKSSEAEEFLKKLRIRLPNNAVSWTSPGTVLDALLHELGVQPVECALIGAGANACRAAVALGIKTFSVSSMSKRLLQWLELGLGDGEFVRTIDGGRLLPIYVGGRPLPIYFWGYYISGWVDDLFGSALDDDTYRWRHFIFSFKSPKTPGDQLLAAELVEARIRLSSKKLSDLTFVCLPAATRQRNEQRYRAFSERVCRDLGMSNGFEHVQILFDRETKHENQNVNIGNYRIDREWFRGRTVVLFDDVITRGISLAKMADELIRAGADVLFFCRDLGGTLFA